MSAVATPTIPRLPHSGKVTQARVIVSEWTKLKSLRSTRYSLVAALLLTIGIAALACAVVAHHWAHMSFQDRHDFHPLEVNLAGVQIAQLAIGVLGVLVITGEYSTGMIRATMTAVPKRLPVLWAKAIVYGVVVLALAIPATLIAFVVGQSILARHHIDIAFSHPGVMFVLPPLMNVLPRSWNDAATPYLPLSAGQAIMALTRGEHQLAPWTGLGLLCAYTAAALAAASVLLVSRDT